MDYCMERAGRPDDCAHHFMPLTAASAPLLLAATITSTQAHTVFSAARLEKAASFRTTLDDKEDLSQHRYNPTQSKRPAVIMLAADLGGAHEEK